MPLRTDTRVEYYFDNAYLYYCKEHECLRVSNNHEDSVVLNNDELKEAFNEALEDETEEELTDCEGRPI